MEANILLIRHAQAYGNVSGKIGYDGKDDTLTELGIRQAISLRSQLSRVLENREYSISLSEANRTLQTASYGGIIGSNTSFVITPALNEIDMGSLCGQILTKENHRIFREVLSGSVEKFPSGESKNDVKNRILSYLIQLNPKTLHVCVTHGVAISAVLSHIDPSLTLRPKNGSITPLLLENGKLSLSN